MPISTRPLDVKKQPRKLLQTQEAKDARKKYLDDMRDPTKHAKRRLYEKKYRERNKAKLKQYSENYQEKLKSVGR